MSLVPGIVWKKAVAFFAALPPELEERLLLEVRAKRIAGEELPDDLSLARVLEQIAIEKRDNRFRHAAAVLRSDISPGREPIDDDSALLEVDRLISAGEAGPNEAYRRVAKRIAAADPEGPKLASIVRRLKKKRAAQKKW